MWEEGRNGGSDAYPALNATSCAVTGPDAEAIAAFVPLLPAVEWTASCSKQASKSYRPAMPEPADRRMRLATGLPVLVSAGGGIPELVEDGDYRPFAEAL